MAKLKYKIYAENFAKFYPRKTFCMCNFLFPKYNTKAVKIFRLDKYKYYC